ncbi:MAG: sulfur carrier protein ThiS [Flavobacteriales bacterium]|nr:sulfur carrier protein ThiS [Flavobacteriales bacterium]
MEITVNNQEITVDSHLILSDYLASKELNEKRGIAVAVNERVIARNDWQSHELTENDRVLIIHATQGG